MGLNLKETAAEFDKLVKRALSDAATVAGRVNEVPWIVAFHERVSTDLELALRATPSRTGPVNVASSLVHGTTFTVDVPGSTSGAEIGDLLIVGETLDSKTSTVLRREALLLQMKIGFASPTGPSSANQLRLYGTWKAVGWRTSFLRDRTPRPRTVKPAERGVARFGLLPSSLRGKPAECREVASTTALDASGIPLAAAMALPACISLGIDATPGAPDGWSRVVEDMLSIARVREYQDKSRHHEVAVPHDSRYEERRDHMLVLVVRSAPQAID